MPIIGVIRLRHLNAFFLAFSSSKSMKNGHVRLSTMLLVPSYIADLNSVWRVC